MNKFGLDDTRGYVIGDFSVRGQLWANGRFQGAQFIEDTAEIVTQKAKAHVDKLKADLGEEEYKRVFPDGFELRIWE